MNEELYQQGAQFFARNQLAEARRCFTQLATNNSLDVAAIQMLGVIAAREGNYTRGLEIVGQAEQLNVVLAAMLQHNKGFMLRDIGKFSEAEACYREALRLRPNYTEAAFNLSNIIRVAEGDPLFEQLAAILSREDLTPHDRGFAEFAAAKIHDDVGRYDEAFAHYLKANASIQVKYSPEHYEQSIEQIIAAFSEDTLKKWPNRAEVGGEFLFVVGMPRSGTTLVEQILVRNPEVATLGESMAMTGIAANLPRHHPNQLPFPKCISDYPEQALTGFADEYLRRSREKVGEAKYIVDKLPQNYFFIGLIRCLFPAAQIVHCRRNPLDTCLSCFFQKFGAGQEYSYNLEHLAHCYREYQKLMAHWKQVTPDRIIDIQYEELVRDPEKTGRELFAQCGLSFDENMLRVEESATPVATASTQQVRRPIYTSSVERWRNYESHLGPLIAALGLESNE